MVAKQGGYAYAYTMEEPSATASGRRAAATESGENNAITKMM